MALMDSSFNSGYCPLSSSSSSLILVISQPLLRRSCASATSSPPNSSLPPRRTRRSTSSSSWTLPTSSLPSSVTRGSRTIPYEKPSVTSLPPSPHLSLFLFISISLLLLLFPLGRLFPCFFSVHGSLEPLFSISDFGFSISTRNCSSAMRTFETTTCPCSTGFTCSLRESTSM